MAIVGPILGMTLALMLQHLTELLVFAAVFLSSRYYMIAHKKRPLPPGPWGVPILGFIPFLGKSMHLTLHELSKKFGPVFSLNIGLKTIIVITDPDLIRQSFKKEEFTGRPNSKIYDMFQGNGVINIAGDKWKQQRKFLHERLRTLGMKLSGPGREQMEHVIMNEVEQLLQELASVKGQSINVDSYLKNASANVVCSMMMSVRFEKENPIFQRFMELHQEGFKLFLAADMGSYLPIMRYTPFVKNSIQKLEVNRNESLSMLQSYVEERRKNFDPTCNRDIVDAYLHEEYMAKLEGKSDDDEYNHQLLQVMCDLFSAGQETTYTCLNWCLVFLLRNRSVTKQIQEELDRVVGRSRLPSLDDTPLLPYTEATICEVLRRANINPLGTPHATTKDTMLGEYLIPAGTTVFSSLYSCHMDKDIWVNPDKFDPTRFLDENGKVFKPKEFMPFGVGRRMCLGEVIAKSEIWLFITSILHVFTLQPAEDPKDYPSTNGITQVTTVPNPYKIRFVPREISILPTKDFNEVK